MARHIKLQGKIRCVRRIARAESWNVRLRLGLRDVTAVRFGVDSIGLIRFEIVKDVLC